MPHILKIEINEALNFLEGNNKNTTGETTATGTNYNT